MPELRTARLSLHPVDAAEAQRILAGAAGPGERWAPDYPFEGDLVALRAFLHATTTWGEQRPFGYYRISRRVDGLAVGGIGFTGPPVDGCVEIGYGVAPSGRGHGYAAEAVGALLAFAARRGLVRVTAQTSPDNLASHRTLLRAGLRPQGEADGGLRRYAALLAAGRES
ncbi:MAG: GNAT family protein [Dermatophilaceae bacterium]